MKIRKDRLLLRDTNYQRWLTIWVNLYIIIFNPMQLWTARKVTICSRALPTPMVSQRLILLMRRFNPRKNPDARPCCSPDRKRVSCDTPTAPKQPQALETFNTPVFLTIIGTQTVPTVEVSRYDRSSRGFKIYHSCCLKKIPGPWIFHARRDGKEDTRRAIHTF